MNVDVLEIFDGVKNVEFDRMACCEEYNAELPVFTLAEETVVEWNAKARKQNTKAFIEVFGKDPECYDDVISWIHSLRNENHSAANTMASVG